MSIQIQVLGQPGEDNATLLRVDSGSAVHRLLFDCGEKCLDSLGMSEIQSIDHLFFSHYHMDHICGFDSFFRHNYNRPAEPVTIWGPPGSIEIIHHRMRGYTWNLHQEQPGEWVINELDDGRIRTARFYTTDAFAEAHTEASEYHGTGFLVEKDFSVSVKSLEHGSIPSYAYRIDEPDRENVDPAKLSSLDLKPGRWIRDIKENKDQGAVVAIDGKSYQIGELRDSLLTKTSGKSAAYLTDFILNPASDTWDSCREWIAGVDTLICEAQYRESDHELAAKHSHMTTKRVAQLAADAGVGKLIIQHVSRRYDVAEWYEMLEEARSIFPNTSFPENWQPAERGVDSPNNG